MLKETFTVMRDLPRVREIIAVLMRHGLGNLVQRLGLAHGLERAGDLLRLPGDHGIELLDPPVRVRRALEELGPTFIKLGQVLATRVDVFTPDWIVEFEKLQSAVPPVPFAQLLPELTLVLGRDPNEIFDELDPIPVAPPRLRRCIGPGSRPVKMWCLKSAALASSARSIRICASCGRLPRLWNSSFRKAAVISRCASSMNLPNR